MHSALIDGSARQREDEGARRSSESSIQSMCSTTLHGARGFVGLLGVAGCQLRLDLNFTLYIAALGGQSVMDPAVRVD